MSLWVAGHPGSAINNVLQTVVDAREHHGAPVVPLLHSHVMSTSATAPERARPSSATGMPTLDRPARATLRPLQQQPRKALRYQLFLVQRADRSPVRVVDFGEPAVFDACCRLLVQCALIGQVEVPAPGSPAGTLSFRSALSVHRMFELLDPAVQACNRSLRDTPWQFLLQAGGP